MTVLATKGDIETMTDPLATKADVAALPTRANVNAVSDAVVTLRETVAALGATVSALSTTVDAQRDAQREAIDALSETIDTLSTAVDTQRETVAQVNNTVLALSSTVDRINEAAVRMDGAVGVLDGRLDTLTNIVSPLVPCLVEPNRMPWLVAQQGQALVPTFPDIRMMPLPESCEQARERARLAQ